MRLCHVLALSLLVTGCGGDDFSSNGAGGSGGSGAGGTGGAPSDAGSDGNVIPLGCGPSSVEPLFYSTLDSLADVLNPVRGNGSGAMTNGRFVTAKCGMGVELENGATLSFPEHNNIDYAAGTISFWYRPNFEHTDNQPHAILSAPDSGTRGIRIEKDAANAFSVRLYDDGGRSFGLRVGRDGYALNQGKWVQLRVTWDTEQNAALMHVYFDGVEPPNTVLSDSGPILPSQVADSPISLGCCVGSAAAVIDDLMIFEQVVR